MAALEKHYTIPEIADLWKLSVDKVRAIFRNEPGVVRIGAAESRAKRGYVTLRIPQSTLERVHAALRSSSSQRRVA